MPFEIDSIAVGEGESAGDAIALRFGNLSGRRTEQAVIVIDGGFQDSGERLVSHINDHYGTNDVDLVILTHPDADHASGLKIVLEKMKVGTLLMHQPWNHAEEIKNLFKNGKVTALGLEKKLEKSLQDASDLEALATKLKIPIIEPFQGVTAYSGVMHVLSPAQEFYEDLLPHFRGTPEPANELGFLASFKKAAEEAAEWVSDHLSFDLLDNDDDTTSAENNTSTVILFTIDGHKLLFTGDAGKTTLLHAVDYASSLGISLSDLRFFDVPHHGSKRNLSSKILKKIKTGTAFVSAPKDSDKHPAKKITNALQKHNTKVYVTRGVSLRHHHDAPDRIGWTAASPEPFHDLVEA